MTEHRYFCRNRPPDYGCVPDKFVRTEPSQNDPKFGYQLPTGGYGFVIYDHPLTHAEMYRYELLPSPMTWDVTPPYQPGDVVEDLRRKKRYTVELFDGELYVGDSIPTGAEWVNYEKVGEQ